MAVSGRGRGRTRADKDGDCHGGLHPPRKFDFIFKIRNHEERSDVVIPCKYWHPCRPVPGLLHPLTRVRKFESDIISSERGTDRNPSPFLPVRMCVYGNCVVLLRTVFATAPIVPFDLFQSGSACRIIAIAYAFAVIHERPRRASASAAAVRRRIAAIAPRFP